MSKSANLILKKCYKGNMAKEQTVEDLIRERDFFKARSENLMNRVKQLEYDCAELQRREGDLNQRLKELSYQKVVQYRQSNYSQRRNFVKR
jgi:hypothetical protein